MKKGIIYGLGLLFFLVICCSQDVLEAADVTNPVKLNVNAKKITNRIHYTNTAGTDVAVNLGWAEKVVLGDTGEVAITVTIGTLSSAPTKGDLIIKADVLSSSDPAGTMSVASGWLKYDSTGGIVQSVEVVKNGKTASGSSEVVEIADLNSLCLIKDVNPTTAYLFNFISSLSLHGHVILTAILVDDATATAPQVMGVDVQTVFFNYPGATSPNPTFWLDLIQSEGN